MMSDRNILLNELATKMILRINCALSRDIGQLSFIRRHALLLANPTTSAVHLPTYSLSRQRGTSIARQQVNASNC